MPFITEEELQDYKNQIEQAEESKRAMDYARNKAVKDERETSQKFKIAAIILGIIALLGVAGTVYLMNFSTPKEAISQKKYNTEVKTRDDKILELEETIKNMAMNQELAGQNDASGSAGSLEDKLIYAVQIGAFEDKDLSMYSDGFVNFKEIKSGSFNKYALGNFETLNEAKLFRKELVGLGFRNAFIASYQSGKRIKIEEAW